MTTATLNKCACGEPAEDGRKSCKPCLDAHNFNRALNRDGIKRNVSSRTKLRLILTDNPWQFNCEQLRQQLEVNGVPFPKTTLRRWLEKYDSRPSPGGMVFALRGTSHEAKPRDDEKWWEVLNRLNAEAS